MGFTHCGLITQGAQTRVWQAYKGRALTVIKRYNSCWLLKPIATMKMEYIGW